MKQHSMRGREVAGDAEPSRVLGLGLPLDVLGLPADPPSVGAFSGDSGGVLGLALGFSFAALQLRKCTASLHSKRHVMRTVTADCRTRTDLAGRYARSHGMAREPGRCTRGTQPRCMPLSHCLPPATSLVRDSAQAELSAGLGVDAFLTWASSSPGRSTSPYICRECIGLAQRCNYRHCACLLRLMNRK